MKKILIIALIGIVAATGLWFGRSAYRKHKEKREVAQAEKFLGQKEFAKALLSARQALQTNPNNLGAARIMAVIAEAAGSPNALDWRKRIAELEPTLDNQLIVASCALRFEPSPFPTTQSTLKKVADKATNSVSYHVVAGQLALQLNDRVKAEFHLSEAARLDPKNDNNRLNLAAVRLGSTNAAVRSEARKTLEGLRSSERFASEALRWLARDAADHADFENALKFSDELLSKTNAPDPDRFEHLTLLQRAKKPEYATYLASLQKKAGNDPVEIYKVAAWQIASDNPAKALAWLDTLPASVQAKRPVPVARADALGAMKKWSVLTDFLAAQKWEEQEFLRLALLSHALRMGKDEEVSQANWNRAVRAASENAEQLSVLTQLSGKWGWETETEELLWILAEKFPGQNGALESLDRVYSANRDASGLLRVCELKLRKNPTDNLAKNNVAMISLLLKTNLANAHELAQEVYKAEPKNAGFVSTYAYSLHVQGKTREAVTLLEGLGEAELKKPEIAFYYVVLLNAAGEPDKAKNYLALAENAQVLPEEKKLLGKAL